MLTLYYIIYHYIVSYSLIYYYSILHIIFCPPIFHERRRERRNIQRFKHANCLFYSLLSPKQQSKKYLQKSLHIGCLILQSAVAKCAEVKGEIVIMIIIIIIIIIERIIREIEKVFLSKKRSL